VKKKKFCFFVVKIIKKKKKKFIINQKKKKKKKPAGDAGFFFFFFLGINLDSNEIGYTHTQTEPRVKKAAKRKLQRGKVGALGLTAPDR